MGATFNPLMIVTEFMPLGDLEHLLLDKNVHLSLLTRLEHVFVFYSIPPFLLKLIHSNFQHGKTSRTWNELVT